MAADTSAAWAAVATAAVDATVPDGPGFTKSTSCATATGCVCMLAAAVRGNRALLQRVAFSLLGSCRGCSKSWRQKEAGACQRGN